MSTFERISEKLTEGQNDGQVPLFFAFEPEKGSGKKCLCHGTNSLAQATSTSAESSSESRQTAKTANNANDQYLELIVDKSGSMGAPLPGHLISKDKEALPIIEDFFSTLPPAVEVAARYFGPNVFPDKTACEQSKLLEPFALDNCQKITAELKDINPDGQTPLVYCFQQTREDTKDVPGDITYVLVTDGGESCTDEPCAKIRDEIEAQRAEHPQAKIRVVIVGYSLLPTDKASETLNCIAEKVGGQYLPAKNPEELRAVMGQLSNQLEKEVRQTLEGKLLRQGEP